MIYRGPHRLLHRPCRDLLMFTGICAVIGWRVQLSVLWLVDIYRYWRWWSIVWTTTW